jgi:hypothetical protein
MRPDPTIDEIRKVRHEISAQFDHDPRRLVAHYMELQKSVPEERFFQPQAQSQDMPVTARTNSARTEEFDDE